MAPRQKFSRNEMIDGALNLARSGGLPAITARNLGAQLGCSSQPIFTEFKNMDEVIRETMDAARNLYHGYVLGKGADSDAFRRVDYIRFAKDEPKLFAMMFMSPQQEEYSLNDILSRVFINTETLIESVCMDYKLSRENSYALCSSMWIYIHGIACLCASGMTRFIEPEVEALVNGAFEMFLEKLRNN